jgi:hypothetical protein
MKKRWCWLAAWLLWLSAAAAQENEAPTTLAALRVVSLADVELTLAIAFEAGVLTAALPPYAASGYLTLPAGNHRLEFYEAGAFDDGATPPRRARLGGMTVGLEPGAYASTIVSPLGEVLGLLELLVEPPGAQLRLVGPDGREQIGTVPLQQPLAPGLYQLELSLEGHRPLAYQFEVRGGERLELTLELQPLIDFEVAQAEGLESLIPFLEDNKRMSMPLKVDVTTDSLAVPPAGYALLRLVHVDAQGEAVDVLLAAVPEGEVAVERRRERPFFEAIPLVSDLLPLAASEYVSVPLGRYDLRVQDARTNAPLVTLLDVVLEPGVVYTTYYFRPAQGDETALLLAVDALLRSE